MTTNKSSPPNPKRRWYHSTPDRFVVGLLAVEVFLLLCDYFEWFPFNERKGWTVLIGSAVLGVGILVLMAWFGVALIFRRGFRFGLPTLLLFVVVCAVVCSWLAVKMNEARKQREAVAELRALEATVFYDCTTLVPRPSGFSDWREVTSYPSWLVEPLGVDYFHCVTHVTISSHKLESLRFLKQLPSLQRVMIPWNSRQDDAVLEAYRSELPGVSIQVVVAVVG